MAAPELATAPTLDRASDQFLLDAYTGKGGFKTGEYLIPHPRETLAKFERRQQLAVYPNFCRKIVNVYQGFLWNQAPIRETDSDLYSRFEANADGAGTSLNRCLYAYQRLAQILGTVYIIVDKAATPARTRAEETLPYLALRLPGQLVAETKDSQNRWESVTFVEQDGGKPRYRTYTRTEWWVSEDKEGQRILTDDDGNELAGSYDLGDRVPVVPLHIAEPLDPADSRADTWFYDLAGMNWDLYNARSELRELFRGQTFSILTMPVGSDKEREALSDLTISTENALAYNPNGGGEPGYVAPPSDPVDLYLKLIAGTVEDIYRIANLEFVGGVQQSGVALGFHFQEANSTLAGQNEQCEQAESEIAVLVHAWQGQDFDGNIAYNTDFNLSDLKEELAVAMDSVSMQMGPEFDKALKKRLAKKVLANDASPKVMDAIDKEIDAAGDEYGDRVAKEAATAQSTMQQTGAT